MPFHIPLPYPPAGPAPVPLRYGLSGEKTCKHEEIKVIADVNADKIKDIALKANVSISTVSRIINKSKYVSPELVERVNSIIEETGYMPDQIARSMVTKKTKLIGIIIPDISQRFYSILLSGIEEITSEYDYNILICNINENLEKEYKYLNILKTMRVDGIIIMHEKFSSEVEKYLRTINVPIVLSSVKSQNLNALSVNIDDYRASYDAVEYLIKLGHKKIAMIGGDMEDITTEKNRFAGYRQALQDYGIEYDKAYFRIGNFKINDGYRAMNEILNAKSRPTAVFVISDEMALGAVDCITDRGLKVPDDISVVGFDDIDLASTIKPKLTTVHQPIKEIGRMSAELLINQLENKSISVKEVVINHSLVVRDSCCRPPE